MATFPRSASPEERGQLIDARLNAADEEIKRAQDGLAAASTEDEIAIWQARLVSAKERKQNIDTQESIAA